MHIKRQEVPKSWPIERKGTSYVVRPKSHLKSGIPILIILRDMLNLVKNRNEAKKAIRLKNILLNSKFVYDEKTPALLFDVITIVPSKKNYRLVFSDKGKFQLKEIKEDEANYKVAKVIDKKMLKGKKIQINLSDGRNFLSDIKCNLNDSFLINFKEKKVIKCLPLKEKAKIIVFEGKHAGKKGIVKKVISEKEIAEVDIEGKDVNILIKQLIVIE